MSSLALLLLALLPSAAVSLYNPLLPARGWNSWFAFDTHLNESSVRANADAFLRLGLRELNFTLIALDAGWQGGRSPNGTVFANSSIFPSGLGALGSYLHARGLAFGVYTDRGQSTCDGRVGSAGHEAQDASFYASVGADLLKEDSCDATQSHSGALSQFGLMQAALSSSGRPIALSLCGWLQWYAGSASAAGIGTSWRTGPDALSWSNVLMNMDAAALAAPFVAPGRFVDVDEVMGPSRGRPINAARTLTQVAFIALVASPMLLSFDLSAMQAGDADLAPFLNEELLEVHWDASLRFQRLQGSSLAPDRITPLTGLPCTSSGQAAQWRFSAQQPGGATGTFASAGAPGLCLMAGAAWSNECQNAQQVWLGQCGVQGAGPNCCHSSSAAGNCTNQLLTLQADGTIVTPYWPSQNNAAGPYLTLDAPTPNSLFFEERLTGPAAARQQWRWDAAAGTLASASDGTCIGAEPRSSTNVWARFLRGGAVALLLINNGPQAQAVSCSSSCLAQAGLSGSFSVRDIMARASNGTGSVQQGFSALVPAGGASVFVKLTPA